MSLSNTLHNLRQSKRLPRAPISRSMVVAILSKLQGCNLTLADQWDCLPCGDGQETNDLTAVLKVKNPAFYRHVVSQGELGAADAYGDGDWECDHLTQLFQMFIRNRPTSKSLTGYASRLRDRCRNVRRWFQGNNRKRSRRNIHAHYDLGNDFFQVFLDESLNYSSAVFDHPSQSLHAASINKMDQLCRDLELVPEDHLVEIGTGWGAFAIHAATQYGCRVTTTTISDSQYRFVIKKVQDLGLQNRITVLNDDYRDLEGVYDKLVSVEMIEAVGYEYLPIFFQKCNSLLRPGGKMSLQAILMNDLHFDSYVKSTDFIREFIFPGACLPCKRVIDDILVQKTELSIVHSTDITAQYAKTLRCWHDSLIARKGEILDLGFDERFLRIWAYYLCYCEAGFMERHCTTVQMKLQRENVS